MRSECFPRKNISILNDIFKKINKNCSYFDISYFRNFINLNLKLF